MRSAVELESSLLARLADAGIGVLIFGGRNASKQAIVLPRAGNDGARRVGQYRRYGDADWRRAWSDAPGAGKAQGPDAPAARGPGRAPGPAPPAHRGAADSSSRPAPASWGTAPFPSRACAGSRARPRRPTSRPSRGCCRSRSASPDATGARPATRSTRCSRSATPCCTSRRCAPATAAGLDPMIGFYHELEFGRESLAADLIEPLRPRVDAWAWEQFRHQVLRAEDFREDGEACLLGKTGRQRFYAEFEALARPLRRLLRRFAARLAARPLAGAAWRPSPIRGGDLIIESRRHAWVAARTRSDARADARPLYIVPLGGHPGGARRPGPVRGARGACPRSSSRCVGSRVSTAATGRTGPPRRCSPARRPGCRWCSSTRTGGGGPRAGSAGAARRALQPAGRVSAAAPGHRDVPALAGGPAPARGLVGGREARRAGGPAQPRAVPRVDQPGGGPSRGASGAASARGSGCAPWPSTGCTGTCRTWDSGSNSELAQAGGPELAKDLAEILMWYLEPARIGWLSASGACAAQRKGEALRPPGHRDLVAALRVPARTGRPFAAGRSPACCTAGWSTTGRQGSALGR